jgi:hypothetical protein
VKAYDCLGGQVCGFFMTILAGVIVNGVFALVFLVLYLAFMKSGPGSLLLLLIFLVFAYYSLRAVYRLATGPRWFAE